MAETIQQYQATQKGGPFAFATVPKPAVGPNEVLYRVKAVALNPIDWKILYLGPPPGQLVDGFPAVLGCDSAGIVEEVGEDVTGFKVGDEVLGVGRAGGKGAAFQELVVVPEFCVGKKPKSISFEEAASLPYEPMHHDCRYAIVLTPKSRIMYITAAAAIHASLRIPLPFLKDSVTSGPKPKSVLVLGGSSGVGASTIQLLRLVLPSAIILTTSSPQHHATLVSLGATKALDRNSSNLVSDIRAATDGRGVETIIDAVGAGATQKDIFAAFSDDSPREYAAVFTAAPLKGPEDVKVHTTFGADIFNAPGGRNALVGLSQLIEQNKFKVPVQVKVVGHGFEAIPKGIEELKAGVSWAKLAITI